MATEKTKQAAEAGKSCTIKVGGKDCKRPFRAKGMCVTHYKAWRRNELEGHKGRYKICTKEGCRKARTFGSLCTEHSGKGAPAEAAA